MCKAHAERVKGTRGGRANNRLIEPGAACYYSSGLPAGNEPVRTMEAVTVCVATDGHSFSAPVALSAWPNPTHEIDLNDYLRRGDIKGC